MIARVVADLRAEGRAERGLRPGDVIRRAGDREVASRAALARPLEAVQAAGQGAIALKVDRAVAGQRLFGMPLRAA
jgi:hypothetical protein